MKESSTLVISVTIKLQHRVIWKLIFNLNMKVSSMLVTNVTWQNILNQNLKLWGMTATSVTTKQQDRITLDNRRSFHRGSSRIQPCTICRCCWCLRTTFVCQLLSSRLYATYLHLSESEHNCLVLCCVVISRSGRWWGDLYPALQGGLAGAGVRRTASWTQPNILNTSNQLKTKIGLH